MNQATPRNDDHGQATWGAIHARQLLETLPLPHHPERGVLAIDGHGGAGKTTLAELLAVCSERRTVIVHIDDIAWHHSFFDWAHELTHGVLQPFLRREPVRYRPPGWVKMGRAGCIEVPEDTELLIAEGTGAARTDLSIEPHAVIWTHIDLQVAKTRGLERDLASGANGTTLQEVERFWEEWMDQEIPFLDQHKPWQYAHATVHGAPTLAPPAQHVQVLAH